MRLTEREQMIIAAGLNNDHGSAADEPIWLESVIRGSGLDPKIARGVVASLVKKGLAEVTDYEGRGRPADQMIRLINITREG